MHLSRPVITPAEHSSMGDKKRDYDYGMCSMRGMSRGAVRHAEAAAAACRAVRQRGTCCADGAACQAPALRARAPAPPPPAARRRLACAAPLADAELKRLQDELVHLQLWVRAKKLKVGLSGCTLVYVQKYAAGGSALRVALVTPTCAGSAHGSTRVARARTHALGARVNLPTRGMARSAR